MKQAADLFKDTDRKGTIIRSTQLLSNLYFVNDDPVSVLKECDKALSLADEVNDTVAKGGLIYRKGTFFLAMNELDKALAGAEDLKQFLETEKTLIRKRMYPLLLGKIESAKRNFPKAIEYFEKAINMTEMFQRDATGISVNEYFYSLAEAYYRSGDLAKAKVEFSKIDIYNIIIATEWERRLDLIGLSTYMLGRISEQQGDRAQAIEFYEKFLSLWKDADPGIAEVDDAKKRLAELKAQ